MPPVQSGLENSRVEDIGPDLVLQPFIHRRNVPIKVQHGDPQPGGVDDLIQKGFLLPRRHPLRP